MIVVLFWFFHNFVVDILRVVRVISNFPTRAALTSEAMSPGLMIGISWSARSLYSCQILPLETMLSTSKSLASETPMLNPSRADTDGQFSTPLQPTLQHFVEMKLTVNPKVG